MRAAWWVFVLACMQYAPLRAEPPPLSAYANLPAGVSAHLSPDGSALAMIGTSAGKPAFLIVHFDGSPARVFSTGGWAPLWIQWKGPGLLLAGVLGTTDNRNTHKVLAATRLLLLAADGSRAKQVDLSFADGFRRELMPSQGDRIVSTLPGDLNHVLMATLDEAGATVSRIDVRSGGRSLEQESRSGVISWYADHDDVVRAALKFRDDLTTDHRPVVDLLARTSVDDRWHTVLSENLDGASGEVFGGFDPNDPDRILLGSDGGHDNRVIRAYRISTGQPGEIVAQEAGQDVVPITRRRQLIGYSTQGRSVGFTYFDAAWRADAQAITRAVGGGTVEIIDRTEDGRHVLACLHDDAMPPQYWLLDRSAGKTSLRLIANSSDQLGAVQVGEQRWVSYKARDGMTIPALLTFPPGRKAGSPLPFVVLPHGGPASHDRTGFDFFAQFIASRGYGVLQPQFRGSTGFGRGLFDAGRQQWGGAMQDDITDGTRYLIAQHLADPSRIAIVGASFGGYAALEGVIREPTLYRGAAALAPVADLPMMFGGVRAFSRPGADLLMPAGDYAGLTAASPVHAVQRITVPVLLVHGRRDFTVPVQQSQTMEAAMKRAGKPVEAVYMDDADHYLETAADRTAWLTALDRFLDANLGRR